MILSQLKHTRGTNLAAFTVVAAIVAACGADNSSDDANNGSGVVGFGADNSLDIGWTCFGNRPDSSGLRSQEEYCEWTRAKRNAGGKLQCEFNTNFDATRPLFLTKNEKSASFPETFANSQQFLVGGTEPTGGEPKKGIVGSCVERKGQCVAPNCICGRKSDPQICAVLGSFARNKCTPEVVAQAQKTARKPVGIEEPNPIVAVQLRIGKTLAQNCFFKNQRTADGKDVVIPGVDPAQEKTYVRCFFDAGQMTNIASCDDAAKSIAAVARVRIKNPSDCNVAGLKSELDGKTPDACKQ